MKTPFDYCEKCLCCRLKVSQSNQLITSKYLQSLLMVSESNSVGFTIMRKTADLTDVQKRFIDTLYKEAKPQKGIAKKDGCSQIALPKHIHRKLSERRKCGIKRCTSNRDNRSPERIVKQRLLKNVLELHKEWTDAGISASRATT